MKSKLPLFIGSLFSVYLLFVAFVVIAYEPIADDKDWQDRQAYNLHHIAQLSLGSDITQIRTTLGVADYSEAKLSKEIAMQVLFYRTQHSLSDGITTKDECTPLLFKAGKLIAWGKTAYQQFLSLNVDT
ncbi:DUF3192 domain-containing protein [Shewanella surugensis]|uniref:DUF3192 domain-containing protein n=1 Tax=Shewanella surugensis TaxID=212020 RepID=A0ABT0LEA4_9GAMM|nr:DUF3192 domain-containing protein [Shewanella surugensis]MCL1126037.1 DUF3192 domain-containing protein [Shewanella surugensis]